MAVVPNVRPVGPFSDEQAQTMVYTVDIGGGHVAEIEGPPGATPEQLQAVYAEHASGQTEGAVEQGGFADELPPQAASRLSGEDEAKVRDMLRGGATADELAAFTSARGFTIGNLEQIIAARDKGKVSNDAIYQLPTVSDQGALGAVTRGAADTLTAGTLQKLGAGAAAIGDAVQGRDFSDSYSRNLDTNNAIVDSDEENHPWLRVSGQLLGGLALPSGLEGVGLKAGTDVLKLGGSMSEARVAAKVAVRNRMALVGGAYGAAHGAGSGDNLADAATGALVEGTTGAVTGLAAGSLARTTKGAQRVSDAEGVGQAVFQAGQRQGVDVLPADVGGPTVRRLTSAAAQAPLSAAPVIGASQRMVGQAQAARDRIAGAIGQALDPEAAGLAIRSGAQRYIADSGADVRGAYRAAETAAGDTRVAPTQAIAALDRNITELGETPGGAPGLATMQALREQLAQGDVAPAGLLRMRTVLRDQFMKDGLVGSDTERRIGQVLDAANDDVSDGLRAAGKSQAASLYASAAAKYKARINTINQVLKPIIGNRDAPRSGEAVAKTLMADLQGNNARAVRLLRTLPFEEQATTRASIIGSLGNASPGGQNAEGSAFSLPHFLTSWNKIGETAKRAYFGDESRAALNDLAKVADATKQAQGYANRSNTAGGIWGNLGILASGAVVAPITSAVGATTQVLGGRLLASPRFARWLARAPRTALSPIAYAERLTRIARAEPAIANEVLQLQQRLTDAFSSVPTRIAADEGVNRGVGVNGQDQQGDQQQELSQP